MESSVVIFGALSFPEGGVERWKEQIADASEHRDWKGDLRIGAPEPQPVASLLDALAALRAARHPPGRIDVDVREDSARVRGYLDDEGTRSWGKRALSAFRAPTRAGGHGRLLVVQPTGDFGYAIDVGDGASRLSALPIDALPDLLETPEGREALALFWEKYPKVDRKVFEDLAQLGLPSERGAAEYAALVDRIAKAPAARLLAAAKELEKGSMGLLTVDRKSGQPTSKVIGFRDIKRITELWPAASALLEGLRAGATGEVRAVAVRLAGAVAPGGVDAVAAFLKAKPEAAAVSAAADVLAEAKHPETVALLIDIVRNPPPGMDEGATRLAASRAIGRIGDAEGIRAVKAMLTPEVVATAEGAGIANLVLELAEQVRSRWRWSPDDLLSLWSAAADAQVRERLRRLLLQSNDRAALKEAMARARTDAERKDFEIAAKRAKPRAKPAAKKAAKKPAAKR